MKIKEPAFFYVGFFVYICIVIRNNMRYLVRYVKDSQIINDLRTNDEAQAFARERQLRLLGYETWTVDSIMEILVG